MTRPRTNRSEPEAAGDPTQTAAGERSEREAAGDKHRNTAVGGGSITYQQLANRAAAAIYSRVRKLTSGSGFPTAQQVLALSEDDLRGAGLSRSKTRAIKDLAAKTVNGDLGLRSIGRHGDEEVIRRLTTVWGVGEWTAHMFLIFKLGRPDVMPAGDLGVQEGLRILDGLDKRPEPEYLLARAEVWRPLRSVAAWFLWRLTDKR